MRKILLLVSVSVLVTGCMGVPFVAVRTLVPPDSFVIGERSVPFKADRDRVEVRPYGGAFRSLYFVVEDRDIEIYDFVVVYDNGDRERYDARLVFNHGTRSRSFALHRGPHRIKSIEFRYRTAGRWADEQANVVVYGVR